MGRILIVLKVCECCNNSFEKLETKSFCKKCYMKSYRQRASYKEKKKLSDKLYRETYKEILKERSKVYNKRYRENNPEVVKESQRKFKQNNPDRYYEIKREWGRRNKHYKNALSATRRFAKRNATPVWLDEDHKWMINEIYSLARLRTELTGVLWHVDHIVALKAINNDNEHIACGLHVPWNLQVITADENLKKSNYYQD
jgi:hypothetical protein